MLHAQALAVLAGLMMPPAEVKAAPLSFVVTFDRAVSAEPFTGRVLVMLSTRSEPRSGPNWFNTEPFFAVDVEGWAPGKPLVVGDEALGYPGPLKELKKANYRIQAVMDFDR